MTKAADRLLLFVAAFGLVISAGCLAAADTRCAISAAAGSALALLNLMVLRTIVLRVIVGDVHNKLPLLALIFVKMGGLMGLVCIAIAREWVEPIGFTLGFSSLVAGLIAGSFVVSRSGPRSEY